MAEHATGTFEVKSWDENPYNEKDGLPKLTRSSVVESFQGDIKGEGTLEYLMMYRDDGSASFVGHQRVVGRIGNRSGSFVLQHTGTFEDGIAKGDWFVVPGSGTGDLRGLGGEGSFIATHGQPNVSFTLDYDFE